MFLSCFELKQVCHLCAFHFTPVYVSRNLKRTNPSKSHYLGKSMVSKTTGNSDAAPQQDGNVENVESGPADVGVHVPIDKKAQRKRKTTKKGTRSAKAGAGDCESGTATSAPSPLVLDAPPSSVAAPVAGAQDNDDKPVKEKKRRVVAPHAFPICVSEARRALKKRGEEPEGQPRRGTKLYEEAMKIQKKKMNYYCASEKAE